jgi:hypothetical protein
MVAVTGSFGRDEGPVAGFCNIFDFGGRFFPVVAYPVVLSTLLLASIYI